ncbi:riboflavin synthase [Terrimonas rubra]|uniref:Riboflavin synthase n=1 Tax=Terrimonas rubra TaxID=1035890 RepID=A0ABW6A8R7_9BACT
MFTGIIETTGIVEKITTNGTNKTFRISSPLAQELKIDQSLCHDGVCLTVEAITNNSYQVTAIKETLLKTNLDQWQTGHIVNLERCLQMNGRLDGHFVQGHVDDTAVCTQVKTLDGSWEYTFTINPQFASLIIEKGSVCINGTSLTCFNVGPDHFTVAIIPYTFEHTNIHLVKENSKVNIEFDVIGKYFLRRQEVEQFKV